jgi:hypothetical protein
VIARLPGAEERAFPDGFFLFGDLHAVRNGVFLSPVAFFLSLEYDTGDIF